jgi:hypothetical protein
MARATTGTTILLAGFPYLVADATLREDHSQAATVTQHAIETGADISDHYRAKLGEVSLDLMFTTAPLFVEVDVPENRPSDAYQALKALQRRADLVSLVTDLEVYEDCALLSVSAPRSAADGDSVTCATTWRITRRVSTETTTVPADILRGLLRASGKGKDSTRDQTSTPSPDVLAADAGAQVADMKRSILKGFKATLGG